MTEPGPAMRTETILCPRECHVACIYSGWPTCPRSMYEEYLSQRDARIAELQAELTATDGALRIAVPYLKPWHGLMDEDAILADLAARYDAEHTP